MLQQEGLEGFVEGYTNIHKIPIYKKKIFFEKKVFPWKNFNSKIQYKKGLCAIAETLH